MEHTPGSDTIPRALAFMAEASTAMQRAMGVAMRSPSIQYHAWTTDVDVMLALVEGGARVSLDAGVSVSVEGADGVRAVIHAYQIGDTRGEFIAGCPRAALSRALSAVRPSLAIAFLSSLDDAGIRALALAEVTR